MRAGPMADAQAPDREHRHDGAMTSTRTQTTTGRPAPALEPPAWPGRKPPVPAGLAVGRNTRPTADVQQA